MTDADDRALVCPGCDYDLRGLPDGTCPECGRGFTRAELLAGLERARRWSWRDRRTPLLGLAMGLWTAIVLGLLSLNGLAYESNRYPVGWGGRWDIGDVGSFIGVMWGMTALWSLLWMHDRSGQPLALLWVWIPTLRTLLLLAALRTPEYRTLLAVEALAGLLMLVWPFWCQPRKSAWITGALFAWIAALLGTIYLVSGMNGVAAGEWWSRWEDFRPGQEYDQYPLSNHEAIRFGIVLSSLGVVAGIGLAATYLRVWSVRTA